MINVQLETDTGNFKDKPSTTDVSVNMTKLQIATGTDDFKELRSTSDVFVDKTLFIKNIIDTLEKAILIMRPRRWGKTLNLDMLLKFLAIEVDDKGERVEINSNKVFFEGGTINIKRNKTKDLAPLQIAEIGGEYMEDQGDYPVIFISLKGVKALTYNEVVLELKNMIERVYLQHAYLQNSIKLNKHDKNKFEQYISQKYENASIKDSLRFLSELLYKHHNQTVYILVDEYDRPVNYFLEHGLDYAPDERKRTAELITGIMSTCGKGNSYLEKIVLTGILDSFTKEGGSGFNNLDVHGISDDVFGGDFGFSEQEVKDLLSQARLPDSLMDPITHWYNGYTLTLLDQTIIKGYTPWSVMKYIQTAMRGRFQPQSYWEESGVNWILEELPINDTLLTTFKHMSDGYEVPLKWLHRRGLLANIEYDLQAKHKPTTALHHQSYAIPYLLFQSGYITLGEEDATYRLPNREVTENFCGTILDKWLCNKLEMLGDSEGRLLKDLHDNIGDHIKFAEIIQKQLLDKMQGEGDKTEAYFQSIVGGLTEWYRIYQPQDAKYQVLVEKSVHQGGRIDHIFLPTLHHSGDTVIIHEYKKLDKIQAGQIDEVLESAINQILAKGYIKEPVAKQHINKANWNTIKIRGVLFVRDENTNLWHIKIDEHILSLDEAKRLVWESPDQSTSKSLWRDRCLSDEKAGNKKIKDL